MWAFGADELVKLDEIIAVGRERVRRVTPPSSRIVDKGVNLFFQSHFGLRSDISQGPVKVGNQIVYILDADREPYQAGINSQEGLRDRLMRHRRGQFD